MTHFYRIECVFFFVITSATLAPTAILKGAAAPFAIFFGLVRGAIDTAPGNDSR